MQLHCLGTAGYHPNETRQTSCYFLPESSIALDAGTGIFRLAKVLKADHLDILLSHAHLDHVLGLTFLLDVLYEHPIKRLRIWGERAKLDAVRNHLLHELIFPAPVDAEWVAIDETPEFEIDGIKVGWRKQEHPGGSVAYRIDWPDGKRLVYCTDTTGDTSPEHAAWIEQADVLLHECYFRDSASEWALKTGHAWTSRVIEIVRASRPKRLLLTHVNPLETLADPIDAERMRDALDAEVTLAEDHLIVDF